MSGYARLAVLLFLLPLAYPVGKAIGDWRDKQQLDKALAPLQEKLDRNELWAQAYKEGWKQGFKDGEDFITNFIRENAQ